MRAHLLLYFVQFQINNGHDLIYFQNERLNVYQKVYLVPPGFEPGPLRVLDARDNHYTTELWIVG